MIKTKITELFGIEAPVIQGGMQYVATPKLAAAVSNAGGLGVLPCTNYKTAEDLQKAIDELNSLTDKVWALNMGTTSAPELMEIYVNAAINNHVKIVETSGSKPEYGRTMAEKGIKVYHKIPTVKFAKKLEEYGYAAIATVGWQAGGHPGPFGVTSELVVEEVLAGVNLPVIMGGGVHDGRGLAAALSYGAQGVLCGTRFLASQESEVNQGIKEWIVNAKSGDTITIKKDNPNRVAKTDCSYKILGMEHSDKNLNEIGKLMLTLKERSSWTSDNYWDYLQSMGMVCGQINEIKSCDDIIKGMVSEAETIIAGLNKFCV